MPGTQPAALRSRTEPLQHSRHIGIPPRPLGPERFASVRDRSQA